LSLIIRLAVPSNPFFYLSFVCDVDTASLAQSRLKQVHCEIDGVSFTIRGIQSKALKERRYVQNIARFAENFPGLEENCKMLHLRKQGWEQRELSRVSGH